MWFVVVRLSRLFVKQHGESERLAQCGFANWERNTASASKYGRQSLLSAQTKRKEANFFLRKMQDEYKSADVKDLHKHLI